LDKRDRKEGESEECSVKKGLINAHGFTYQETYSKPGVIDLGGGRGGGKGAPAGSLSLSRVEKGVGERTKVESQGETKSEGWGELRHIDLKTRLVFETAKTGQIVGADRLERPFSNRRRGDPRESKTMGEGLVTTYRTAKKEGEFQQKEKCLPCTLMTKRKKGLQRP